MSASKWFHARVQSGSTLVSVDFQRSLSSPAQGSDEEDDVASNVQVNVTDPSLANTDQLQVDFVNAAPGEQPVHASAILKNAGAGHFKGPLPDQLLRYRTADGYTSPSSTQSLELSINGYPVDDPEGGRCGAAPCFNMDLWDAAVAQSCRPPSVQDAGELWVIHTTLGLLGGTNNALYYHDHGAQVPEPFFAQSCDGVLPGDLADFLQYGKSSLSQDQALGLWRGLGGSVLPPTSTNWNGQIFVGDRVTYTDPNDPSSTLSGIVVTVVPPDIQPPPATPGPPIQFVTVQNGQVVTLNVDPTTLTVEASAAP